MLYHYFVADVLITVDSAERPKEQLVEIDKTLLVTDEFHLHDTFDDFINFFSTHTQWRLHMRHKGDESGILNLETVVIAREMRPCHLELLYFIFEPRDHIIFV